MMLPRIAWITKMGDTTLSEIELADWSDAKYEARAAVIWSQWNGVYCLAATAYRNNQDANCLYPGFATEHFADTLTKG
jgi:hypothetical protein